uniref:Replication protein A subunit n=1 Tax=Salarias fasciatus TaxID=181472 RepID=A0A672FTN3_SALFA
MSTVLTKGAISALHNGLALDNPVLQLVNIRQLETASGPSRFRLAMSDGQHSSTSFLLATQLNHLPEENILVPNCVCRLKKTITSTVKGGKPVVIVLDMEILMSAEESGGKIGDPVKYNTDGTNRRRAPSLCCVPLPTPRPPPPPPTHHLPVSSFLLTSTALTLHPNSVCMNIDVNYPSPENKERATAQHVFDTTALHLYPCFEKWKCACPQGEIKITAFNKEADKFFSLVEQGKVYYISKATLKVANKQYTSLKNDYEMNLHTNSSIVPCDDSEGVPTLHCDFVPIAELENRDKDAVLDVIGVCKSADDVSRITTKNSREVSKRALSLIDTTGKAVTVTLWGEEAEKFDGSGEPVVAIKGARLSDFGGRSLSALFSSTVMVNPDIPEAFSLRAWYDQGGYALDGQSLTESRSAGSRLSMNWKTLSDIKNEQLGHGEKADCFSCVATVVYIRKENCLYQACPTAECNKKVIDQHNGRYRCEKCNREFPNFKYRLILSANLADFGDNQWVTCFQETAETLLGRSAEDLGELRDRDEEAFDEVFQEASFKTHVFKNRVKLETYNDETRLKVTVLEVLPVDHRDYSRRLLRNIRALAS